jgi:septum formation protein
VPPVPLVLASTSRYRAELLSRLQVAFAVAAPTFDEDAHRGSFADTDDETFALQMARGKAHSLAAAHADDWILAADQIAVLPGPPRCLLTKPGAAAAAVDQLMALAGRTHRLVTGVVLLHPRTGAEHTALDVHRLTLRDLPRAEAEAYVRDFAPLDCVGAYRIEDAGIKLFARIEGHDYTGIVGLPLIAVAGLLRQIGAL